MIRNIFEEIADIIITIFKQEEGIIFIILLLFGGIFVVSFPSVDVWAIVLSILNFFVSTWWLWLLLILIPLFESIVVHWRQEEFKKSLKFILLELRIPREIKKSPQAMEQVLGVLHTLRNAPGDIKETYAEGEVTVWFSLEIVSFGGEIHFYVRAQKKQKNLVEAAFFSYYQDVEVVEVEDYASKLPKNLFDLYVEGKDIWGTEMVLSKEEAYPIKTYRYFENEAEEKQFDPISSFLEVLGKLKKGEVVAMQFLIAPASNSWKDKWIGFLEKLREPSTTKIGVGEEGEREVAIARSPGEVDVLEAVETNLSKPAYDTLVRFIYISPKETYYETFARRGLVGAFAQYAALNLNSLSQNRIISTRTGLWYWPHIFSTERKEYRKQRILYNYIHREVPPERKIGKFIYMYPLNWNLASRRFKMNVECIATLFHPPTSVVLTAPHIKRVESKKGGPPAGLAIYGEDIDIERYH